MTLIDGIAVENILWINRHSVQRVSSTMKRALNGAPLIQQTAIVAGHSLVFGTKEGWISSTQFNEIQARSESTLIPFSLVHNGESMSVIWDHSSGPAVTGSDLFDHVEGDTNITNVTFKFLTV